MRIGGESLRPGSESGEASGCPRCDGTGYEIVRSPESEQELARRCGCRKDLTLERRHRSSAIPRRYSGCRLDNFGCVNDSLTRAMTHARRIVELFPSVDHGLLLCGPCGVGKTHLSVGMLYELVEHRGARGLFQEFNALVRRMRETFDRRSETPSAEVIGPVLAADVLLLDDLGSARVTPWAQDMLSLIVNERYNAKQLTLITSNLRDLPAGSPGALVDRIGPRLTSRLAEMCTTINIDGPDFRRDVKSAEFLSD